jgi:hypothetical protein
MVCSRNREMNAYKILVVTIVGERLLGRPKHTWENNNKRYKMVWCGRD